MAEQAAGGGEPQQESLHHRRSTAARRREAILRTRHTDRQQPRSHRAGNGLLKYAKVRADPRLDFQCRVLLNLRTSQPFEEVLEDLGQVLKMNGAKRMFTVSGQEVNAPPLTPRAIRAGVAFCGRRTLRTRRRK